MYQKHFALSEMPFQLVPDTRLFFDGGYRGDVLVGLQYAIMNGDGIIKVVGEVGSGKTMLCRMLEKQLPETVDVVYIANPSISPDNILNTIAFELQLIKEPRSKLEVMQLLQDWLLQRHSEGRRVVLFIEEAQGMPLATLEEVRLLCNLETEKDKLLQIVLFGQPELDDNLKEVSIRQLRERIAHHFYLKPFDAKSTYAYLNYRMQMAGYKGSSVFSRSHARLLHRYSQGLVRRINLLADKSLLAAYAGGAYRMRDKYIRMATQDSQIKSIKGAWSPWPKRLGMTSVCLLFVLLSLYSWPTLSAYWLNQQAKPKLVTMAIALPNKPENLFNLSEATQYSVTASELNMAQEESDIEDNADKLIESELDVELIEDKKIIELPENREELIADELTLIEQAKNASQQWLDKQPNSARAIQIASLTKSNMKRIENYLTDLHSYNALDSEKIKLYESVIQGQSVVSILYGEYMNKKLAYAAIEQLPERLKRQGPFLVRSVKGVKDEISKSTS